MIVLDDLLAYCFEGRQPAFEAEAYAAGKGAGPDFTVMFKTHMRFNVEVRRFRWGDAKDGSAIGGENGGENSPANGSAGSANGGANDGAFTARLAAIIGDKVRQMPPSSINFLWLAADGGLDVDGVAAAAALLRGRVERKDEAFFLRRGYASATAFLKQYAQMSGVLLWQDEAAALWLNPLARHKPPAGLAAALRRAGA